MRAYLFVCMLALRWRLMKGGVAEDAAAEYQELLLENLSRVMRVEVEMGLEIRTWYLNVTQRLTEGLRPLKLADLLREETRVAAGA